MSVFNLYPTINPTLSFDFVNARALDPSITFTRNTSATYFDETGILRVAGANVPRFDYNPSTLAARGLLIEEQRTNSIRNNTMQGAVAGTPGTLPTNWATFTSLTGLTREVVGTGTESGINYIDIRLSGTPSAAGSYNIFPEGSITTIAAVSGQTWAFTQYSKLAAGSTSGITSLQNVIIEYSAASAFLTQGASNFSPSGAALSGQRSGHTRTLTNASTAFIRSSILLSLDGAAIDITLRIGLPQLELGAFATSVIPTTTTALTRTADVASVNTLSPWWNASEGTFYVEGSAGSLANSPNFVMPHDGTSNNYLNSPLLTTAGLARLAGAVGGAAWTNVNTANSTTANTTFKSASAFKAGDQAICLNAGTVGTGVNASLPVVTTVKLGDWRTSGNNINGHIRRITYYPSRLSNAQLQALTA